MGTHAFRWYQYGDWMAISLLRGISTAWNYQLGESYAY